MIGYRRVCEQITDAATRYRRSLDEIRLIAVTKYAKIEDVHALYSLGQRDFGESRVPDLLEKQPIMSKECRWHFIGTLQRNKVRKLIGQTTLIHAVDTLPLAQKISQCSEEAGITTHVLLQANTSGELSKHGQTAEEWKRNLEELLSLPSLSIDGLMTMAPLVEDEGAVRSCFANLRHLRDELQQQAGDRASLHHLSMGMSHDFTWAIAEGATLLRIGSALFAA